MLPTDGDGAAAEIVGSGRIAMVVPGYNEEAVIGKVVAAFRAALPEAGVRVYLAQRGPADERRD